MKQTHPTIETRLEALYGKRSQVIKPGLERMAVALKYLEPQLLEIPTVLIGGTNGKGTTAGYLWELLVRSRCRVGIYTSPHLWRFAERIQVSGESIDEAWLLTELTQLEQDLPKEVLADLSFFELTTLLAIRTFSKMKTDVMVLEVGMGGRFDATNVSHPMLSIITSIGLDHQQFLGSSTAEIAREKAGIIRPGRPLLWGGPKDGDTASHEVIVGAAKELKAPLWLQGEHFGIEQDSLTVALPHLPVYRAMTLPEEIRKAAPYLQENFAKAAAAYVFLCGQGKASQPLPDVLAAWERVKVGRAPSRFGRFHQLQVAPPGFPPRSVLLDVSHNPQGAHALTFGLRAGGLLEGGPLPGLVSILGDKDVNSVLDILRSVLSPLYLFASSSDRSWSRDMLAPRHQDLPFFEDLMGAWQALSVQTQWEPVILTGSVYATGEAFKLFGIDPLHYDLS